MEIKNFANIKISDMSKIEIMEGLTIIFEQALSDLDQNMDTDKFNQTIERLSYLVPDKFKNMKFGEVINVFTVNLYQEKWPKLTIVTIMQLLYERNKISMFNDQKEKQDNWKKQIMENFKNVDTSQGYGKSMIWKLNQYLEGKITKENWHQYRLKYIVESDVLKDV
jgi:hypothetical protein